MNGSYFIYVMSEEDKDKLLSMGYTLLKKHDNAPVWVFCNQDNLTFSSDIKCVLSDTLTF